MLLRYTLLFISFNLIAQSGSVENVSLFTRPEPDLLTQVARIQEARMLAHHIPAPTIMTEDNQHNDQLQPEATLSCLCCTGVIGGYVIESLIPTVACDQMRFGIKIGAAAAVAPTLWILNKPIVNRTINDAYKALINKFD